MRALAVLRAWQGVPALPAWLGVTCDALLLLLFVAPVYVLALLYNSEYHATIAQRVLLLCTPKDDAHRGAAPRSSFMTNIEAVLVRRPPPRLLPPLSVP